jgi:hypothetical protein
MRPTYLRLALVMAALGAFATTAAGRTPIVARGHRFVPAVGDWEGTANGFPASFALVYNTRAANRGRSPYAFQDMTLLEPASCPAASFRYTDAVISARPALTPLGAGGRFPLASFAVTGSLTGAASATLKGSYSVPSEPGAEGCSGTLVWRMRPVRRRAVADGTWTLRYSDGEKKTLTVSAGGRLATGVASPANAPGCDEQAGGADLFIGASGAASFAEPNGFSVSLTFAATTATGTLSVGSRCTATLSGSLIKRAR